MEKKEELLESFKTAITSTVKSISNQDDIEVVFGNKSANNDKITINLPDLEKNSLDVNFLKIRAFADSEALKARHSDKNILRSYEPKGNISKKLYSISEKIRYEKLGSEEFKGIKSNIDKYYKEKINSIDLKKNENKIVEAFENYLRVNIFNLKNNKEVDKEFKPFKKDFDFKLKNKFKILSESINNQSKFNSLISNLISEMNIDEDIENPKNDQVDENKDNKESKSRESEKSSKENKQENQEMSIDAGVPDIENLSEESNNKEETVNIEDSSIDKDYRSKREKNFGDQKYKVYTEEFDETVKA